GALLLQSIDDFRRDSLNSGELLKGSQDAALSWSSTVLLDGFNHLLQFLLAHSDASLEERVAQLVGKLTGAGVINVQFAAGIAEHTAERALDHRAIGVQFFFVFDLGADQDFRPAGQLLDRNFAIDLSRERSADLLHWRLLVEPQIQKRSTVEVNPVTGT